MWDFTKALFFLLLFAPCVHAQGFGEVDATHIVLANNDTGTVNALTIYMSRNTTGPLTWYLPASNGTSGYVLTTDGANPATLSWTTPSSLPAPTEAVIIDPATSARNTIQPTTDGKTALTLENTAADDAAPTQKFNIVKSDGTTNMISLSSQGDIYVGNAARFPSNGAVVTDGTVQMLATTGTSGYVLTSNGISGPPTFQAAGGGGAVSITDPTSTLTVAPSPLTGTGTIGLNLASANTWTASQTFNNGIVFGGSSTITDGTLSVGTYGQTLISQGAGLTPVWATIVDSPGYILNLPYHFTKIQTANFNLLGVGAITSPADTDIALTLTSHGSGTGTIQSWRNSGGQVARVAYDGTINSNSDINASGNLSAASGTVTLGTGSFATGIVEFLESGSSHNGQLTAALLTANRTWTLPDATGTIALIPSGGADSGSYIVNQTAAEQTGGFNITGPAILGTGGSLTFWDAANSGSSTIAAPTSLSSGYAITLPNNGGTMALVDSGGGLIQVTAPLSISNSGGITTIGDTAAASLSNPMTTAGDIIYGGTSGTPTRRAIGSPYYPLVVDHVTDLPSWEQLDLTQGVQGILPLENGGTGLNAIPTDGQLLIGQTSDHSLGLATITAGANVTVTNAGHSITIAATSSGMANPMTTLGDIIYENATPAPARLARGDSTMFMGVAGWGDHIPRWTDTIFRNSTGASLPLMPAPGIILANTTAATSGTKLQPSSSIMWRAEQWNTAGSGHDSTSIATEALYGTSVIPQPNVVGSSINFTDAYSTTWLCTYINGLSGWANKIGGINFPVFAISGADGGSSYYWGYNFALGSMGAAVVNTVVNSGIVGGGAGGTTQVGDNAITGTGNGYVIIGGITNAIAGNGTYAAGGGGIFGGYVNKIAGRNDIIMGGQDNYDASYGGATMGGLEDTIPGTTLGGGNPGVGMVNLGGEGLYALANGQVVLGQWNVIDGQHSTSGYSLLDTAFIIGNGTAAGTSRHDAVTINKLGDIGTQGHIITRDTIGAATGDGTGVTAQSVTGSDVAGTITITTALAAGGGWVNIAFGRTYNPAPVVVFSPSNAAASALAVADGGYVSVTAGALRLNWAATIAEAGATFNYHVIDVQH